MLVDAIHEATGKAVYIKEVGADSEELRIIELLTQDDWLNDSRNHCVPVKKVFKDHQDPGIAYIVMPLMRSVDNPPFETVKEIIRFTDQILEVTMNLFTASAPNSDISRAWYSSTRKALHTGAVYYSDIRQFFDQFPEIASRRTS